MRGVSLGGSTARGIVDDASSKAPANADSTSPMARQSLYDALAITVSYTSSSVDDQLLSHTRRH
jgi:hypothetical protein